MLFTYEIALRNEKGDVLRNFGGSFPTNSQRPYLLVSDLINFASDSSEQANKADNSAMVPCPFYHYTNAEKCRLGLSDTCKPVPCMLQRARHQ